MVLEMDDAEHIDEHVQIQQKKAVVKSHIAERIENNKDLPA